MSSRSSDGGPSLHADAAWAVWAGHPRDNRCVAVTADTEEEAREKALEESYGDDVVYTTVTNVLAGLEQIGLAESERDGRNKNYCVTDAGERELRADINWRQQ